MLFRKDYSERIYKSITGEARRGFPCVKLYVRQSIIDKFGTRGVTFEVLLMWLACTQQV